MNANIPPIIRLRKLYQPAPEIRRAEKSAAGTMPAGAFQYCEAMREASSFGWYVYPPKDIILTFDGRETFYFEDGQWYPVKSVNFEDEFRSLWNANAPDRLLNCDPPFLSELFVPGIIQIWSGYFVFTSADWSLLIRQPVNYDIRSSFTHYEGLVETDQFQPCPLFINIRLLSTGREIFIAKERPLFQIQPIHRSCYRGVGEQIAIESGFDEGAISFDWDGVMKTVRKNELREQRRPGAYAVGARRRD